MTEPTIWVATKLEHKFMIAELILRPGKILTVVDGELYSEEQGGKVHLGKFLGLAGTPEILENVLDVSPGDEVLIIPTSGV